MSEILDSGERRKFESGAVRDIAEGKGRMDLMPLDMLAELVAYRNERKPVQEFNLRWMLEYISLFMKTGSTNAIYNLLISFIDCVYQGSLETAFLDLSIHYEQGARKYEERNWEKGMNCHCFIDSALRHGMKFLRGDDDEPHGRAFMWNLLGVIWTMINRPDFNDLPFNTDRKPPKDSSETEADEISVNPHLQDFRNGLDEEIDQILEESDPVEDLLQEN